MAVKAHFSSLDEGPHLWPMAELSFTMLHLAAFILFERCSLKVSLESSVMPRYVTLSVYEIGAVSYTHLTLPTKA